MTNTHHHHFALKHATIAALFVGIMTVVSSTDALLTAQLSGGGATLLSTPQAEPNLTIVPALHAAAPVAAADTVQARLLIGMLLILLGFTLHMLNIRRMQHLHFEPIQALRTKKSFQIKAWYRRYLNRPLGDG